MDVTAGAGHERVTRQPGFRTRLRMPKAIRESNSLKPSNVRMAMCMETPTGNSRLPRPASSYAPGAGMTRSAARWPGEPAVHYIPPEGGPVMPEQVLIFGKDT